MAPLALHPMEDLALSPAVALPALGIRTAAERAGLPRVAGHSPRAPRIAARKARQIKPNMIRKIVMILSSARPL